MICLIAPNTTQPGPAEKTASHQLLRFSAVLGGIKRR